MRKLSTHAEWLRLVEVSGPFISTTMLERAFPQGLESTDTPRRQRLRSAYEEWRDAVDENDPQLAELHREWVRLVLEDILEYDREILFGRDDFGAAYVCRAPECAVTFAPDLAVKAAGDERPRLFISIHPPDVDLEKAQVNDGWPVPLVERMTLLCRTTGVRLGLVTNGERWMLVNAPVGSTSSHVSWYSRLWFQEPVTLKAFLSLLGVRRCFGPVEETLDALLEESLKHHEEVTDTLGEQVRRAVEVLVQCLDKADQDRNRELLHDVSPAELYEAGLTIMMRLVFVLCAEERGLLLLDDPVYDQHYAISTLRGQLAEDADRHGPEVLDRRHDAWTRLLAVFRAIYGGINHESLRMPALGSSLFDPDRFPFLEGRAKRTKWRETTAAPLPIDNRTVLLLLEALQLLEQKGGALLLSYKALDVENIGHVYEGLLEHTVARVPEVTLGLVGSQKAKNPNISLRELEMALTRNERALTDVLLEKTQRSELAIRNALAKPVDEALFGRVLTVCGGDTDLAHRVLSFANLLRTDAWDDPIVYRAHSFMVTIGADRRETGTHYTPKSLTETIVASTLEPVAFFGPTEGKPREEWRRKSPAELLDLKICDPAMGSGAFLVQACRWLAEQLVESWMEVEREGNFVTVDGEIVARLEGDEPMPSDLGERLLISRRLVAERCLYGVDLNPLAVELAKLSIWLITMAKGRPFGFLDHNLRCGDSLLGIYRLDQLTELSMTPGNKGQQRLFGRNIEQAVSEAIDLRQQLRKMPIRDIYDVEAMASLDADARRRLEFPERIADAFIGEVLSLSGSDVALEKALTSLAILAGQAIAGRNDDFKQIINKAITTLSVDLPDGKTTRQPFHWPLEFPEVFARESRGFNCVIGNPPFMRGTKIQTNFSERYLRYLLIATPGINGNADLSAHFFRKAFILINKSGALGLISTNTISQGDTRIGGLQRIIDAGGIIYNATDSLPWPGRASVVVSIVQIYAGKWNGSKTLNHENVNNIDSHLSSHHAELDPFCLKSQWCNYHNGSFLNGMGFVIDKEEALIILADKKYEEVVRPYIGGKELYGRPDPEIPDRYIIYFGKMSIDEASNWPKALSIVRERVLPERENHENKSLREKWWIFKRPTPELYAECKRKKYVIAKTQVSSTFAFIMLPAWYIFDQRLIVFTDEGFDTFAVLQSSLHELWAERYAATLKNDMSYTPKDCFENFPFPATREKKLFEIGEKYHDYRSLLMRSRRLGLTAITKLVNSPLNIDEDIQRMRSLQCDLDSIVASSYGWNDMELSRTFVETNQGWRYVLNEASSREILQRLFCLNYQCYQKEIVQDLHCSSNTKKPRAAKRSLQSESCLQPGLHFDIPLTD